MMRKDQSLVTYGRHRNRVIVTDVWSSEERKKKNIFGTSSEFDSSKQSNIFQSSGSENGSLSLNSSDFSDVHTSYSKRKTLKSRAQKQTKKTEEKENVGPGQVAARRIRNTRVRGDQNDASALATSGSDCSVGSEFGVRPALRERKKNVNYNDSASLKKQLKGTTAKRKRATKITSVPKEYSVNFSDFDDYSLVISDTSDRKLRNNASSIETSTPVAKRTRCKDTAFDKIKASDISHIELVDSPTSDVCYTSLETPPSIRQSHDNHFCSPSLVSSACSIDQKTNTSSNNTNVIDPKVTPGNAVVKLDKLTESFINAQLSDKRPINSRVKDLERVDLSASLFSPAANKGEESVHKLTEMLEKVSFHVDDDSESDHESGLEETEEEECETDSEEEEEEEESGEEEEDGEEGAEGLSAIHEVEEDYNDEEEEEEETDCSDECSESDTTDESDSEDSRSPKTTVIRAARNKDKGKLDKKAVVNMQRLSESLLSNHVSSRQRGGRRGRHKQSDEFSENEETSGIELSSGRGSDSSNCTLYMLADSYQSVMSVSGENSGKNLSSDLFESLDAHENGESSIESLAVSGELEEESESEGEEQSDHGEVESGAEEEDKAEDDSRTSKTPKRITLRNRTVESLQNSFSEMLTPTRKKGSMVPISAETKVMVLCEQSQPVSFQEALPGRMLSLCKKIGEGVYGEVFSSKLDKENVAIKIIPIEGDFTVNDEPQKKFGEILPEIVIAKELSDLRHSKVENTSNFCEVKSVSLVEGKYPAQLIRQWDIFNKTKGSENDRPDMFPANQLYVLFVFADCGRDLESYDFTSMDQARSVLTQVTFALAVAEHHLQFEHRDLHWGNILIRPTDREEIKFQLMGRWFHIPTMGVEANVIDFTLSRLRKDGVTVYSDLSTDDSLFEGEGDLQFDVYRNMKKENKNDWEKFHPFTNVLWLHYMADKLVYMKRYPSQTTRHSRESLRLFRQFLSQIQNYHSACEMAIGADFLNS